MKPIKKWKANKRVDGKGTPSNRERASFAESTLLYYYEIKSGRPIAYDALDSCLIDLLSDISHYAASNGIEPEALYTVASINFESER